MPRVPLIQLNNVSVSLAGRRVLSGIDWCWRPGEHWAVLGANGSGKSTWLRLVAGELPPDPVTGGQRRYGLDGELTPSPIGARERIALISPEQQERYGQLEWTRTGWDVLLTGFHRTDYLYRRVTAEQRAEARELVRELALEPWLRRDVQTLSQGELRRLLIARSLLGRPRLLLLDEFTDGLDAAMRERLLGRVGRMAMAGTHLLCATHRGEEIIPAITHTVMLEEGRVARVTRATGHPRPRHPGKLSEGRKGGLPAAEVSSRTPLRSKKSASSPRPPPLTPSLPINLTPDHPSPHPSPLLRGEERDGVRGAPRSGSGTEIAGVPGPCVLSPRRARGEGARRAAAGAFIFRLREVSVFLGRKAILRRLNWELRPGEHWAVTGLNGAGKSTFLKLLRGELHAATGGVVHRFGETRRHTLWEIRERVGYAGPDLQTAYREDLTAREVVASGFFASVGLLDAVTPRQWRRVRQLLAAWQLAELAGEQFLRLSYGQRRRVLIARALVHDPGVLLLDEPLDGLDPGALESMRGWLGKLAARVALVVVTHRRGDLPDIGFRELLLGPPR